MSFPIEKKGGFAPKTKGKENRNSRVLFLYRKKGPTTEGEPRKGPCVPYHRKGGLSSGERGNTDEFGKKKRKLPVPEEESRRFLGKKGEKNGRSEGGR